jgi:hypothetical protein
MSKLLFFFLLLDAWSSLPLDGSQRTLYAFTRLTCGQHPQPVSSFFILSVLKYTSEYTKSELVLGNLSVCSVHLCAGSRRTVGVVAECALSVTTDSRRGAVMWRATKSHPKWRSMPTNETPSRDRLRAPELFPLLLLLYTVHRFCISTIATHKLASEVCHSRK